MKNDIITNNCYYNIFFLRNKNNKTYTERRAEIKKAEGVRQGKILRAHGEAEAIKLVNEAANKYFKGNAQVLRKLETVEKALKDNAKIVIPAKTELVNVIVELAGVAPIRGGKK